MGSLTLPNSFDTSSVTKMNDMFQLCGEEALSSLVLPNSFNTVNVTNMSGMFSAMRKLESLTFSSSFDTSSVTDMSNMFNGTGEDSETGFALTLPATFNTSSVTNMSEMFYRTGYTAMTNLNLGPAFNTSSVTNMSKMFSYCGATAMTELDLGDKFYTTNVTDMTEMFAYCGVNAMTKLDLGQAFTNIPDKLLDAEGNETENSAHTDIFTNCGKGNYNLETEEGTGGLNCTIYAPEAIYSSQKAFKLNSADTNTANLISYTGTIIPKYKPEWTHTSTLDTTNDRLTVTVKGAAYKNEAINANLNINYAGNVTSTLAKEDIKVYFDGIEVTSTTNPQIVVNAAQESTNATSQKTEVTHTIVLSNFEEAVRQATLPYKEWSGNISLKLAGRGKETSTYTANVLKDEYGNQSMMETDEGQAVGTWIDIKLDDTDVTTNTNGTMYTDFIKPEFTYKSSETTIGDGNHGDTKKVTVIFDVVDKYFSTSSLATDTSANLITVKVDNEDVNSAITKTLAKKTIDAEVTENGKTYKTNGDIYYTVNGVSKKIGERYELVVSNLEKLDGYTYSGPMTLAFGSGIVTDLSSNTNKPTTLTIGVDETDGNNTNDGTGDSGSPAIVDVVDPVWKVKNLTTTTTGGITTSTMDIIATDKYFKQSTLTKEQVQVIVEGINIAANDANGNPIAPELETTLSEAQYIKWNKDTETYVAASEAEANGVKYTYTVSNLEESDSLFFENRADYAEDPTTGRVYREYSGPTTVLIPADTVEDNSGNKNLPFTINIGTIDTLKPEVIKVSSQSNINATNVELSTHTIVFDIVDKYLDTSAITTTDTSKIQVYLDGERADTITKTITNIQQLNATVGDSTEKVGYRYTLVLSGFEKARTSIDYNREFTDWSGALTVKIAANTAYDKNNLANVETTLAGNEINTSTLNQADHVDYIKPDATYEFSETDIAEDPEDGKTFTMEFDITDKFYAGETLSISDLQILLSEENETGEGEDGYINLSTNTHVGKSLREQDITNTVNGSSKVIGKRYTLVLTNLEQIQKIEGNQYLDYSGVITVAIPQGKVTDSGPNGDGTNPNGNDATSITSGIDIPGGEIIDIEAIDVVAPIWERVSFTTDIHNKTATINLLGTDKYFFDFEKDGDLTITSDDGYGTLTSNEIKLFVDGVETTGNITISGENRLYEERIVLPEYGDGDVDPNPTTEDVQYGVEYTITVTNFPIDAKQVKVRLTEGSLIDKSNNSSKTTEFLVYNTLIATMGETEPTSKFLNEIVPAGRTAIARQDIEKVVFVNSTAGSKAAGVQNVWDASAQRDNSILAWYSETSAPYTVYIGSDDPIYGNVDSERLFSYIGYGESSTVLTNVVDGLDLLHTENVTDMSYMFYNFGHRVMTGLTLPNTFDTSNVTNMAQMFAGCGQLAMSSFSFGTGFDTNNVTDMSHMFYFFGATTLPGLTLPTTFNTSSVTDMTAMFQSCGQDAMSSLNLGSNFFTSQVQEMDYMFQGCGKEELITLNLGGEFDTSNVTTMQAMFHMCGYSSLTTLTLGNKFDTRKVENMRDMFKGCGYNELTALDLGEKFYTTAATDMSYMFQLCGTVAMETLDLGPAFTKIVVPEGGAAFVEETGENGTCIIYAPESIYSDIHHFRLNTDSTTKLDYTRATINPKYKPEWSKVSSSLTIEEQDNLADSTMTVVVNGKVDPTVYTNAIQTITSAVVAGNDANNQINVYVDGELAEDIAQTIEVQKNTATEVQYKITLSNFEKAIRKSGKNFKEWAGNVSLQFVRGSLIDAYGNKNMMEIDVNPADLTVKDRVEIEDATLLSANVATDKMFADYIKPEFTYEYYNSEVEGDTNANTVIDYVNNKITIVFDVTDKYFASTTLATDTTGSNITVKVDGDVDANTAIGKALSKKTLATDEVVDNITYKANGDIYYTVNGVSKKIGERYELVITGLESSNGVGYSGPMTLAFPAGTITDESGNTSTPTTITIGIDAPNSSEDETKHPEHNSQVIVDVVNPVWSYADSEIDRTNKQVNIYLIGSDKYYKENTLDIGDITVFVDESSGMVDTNRDGTADAAVSGITKNLTDITDDIDETRLNELIAGAGLTSSMTADNKLTAVGVVYKLTLSTFGTISGQTKFTIAADTIEDYSKNKNTLTTIEVGNVTWEEANEPLEPGQTGYPRYPAFRNDIVDFIVPTINYTYSTVEGAKNPDVNYVQKTVTLKFTVTDKYLLESDLMKTSVDGAGNTIYLPKNMKILVDETEVYNGNLETQTTQVTATISSTDIANGKEYTLVVSNIQQEVDSPTNTLPDNGDTGDGFDFSGPMQVVFEPGVIEDTSGNVNTATTISLDTEIGSDIVDVVDPIIKYNSSTINRDNKTVTLSVKAEDKYLASESLVGAEESLKIRVKYEDEDGNVQVTESTTIVPTITKSLTQPTYMNFNIKLENFTVYEGKTSVIIPAGVIRDTSGNVNEETEILVNKADDSTAFKDGIVDYTKPTWEYVTSSIQRNRTGETGTVTLEVKGTDIYFDEKYFNDEDYQLDLSAVKVFINGTENASITKTFATNADGSIKKEYIEETKELATGYSRVFKGVKYTIILGNFTTNEGTVKIQIPENAIRDTSLNGNIPTPIDVGNPQWVETDVEDLATTDPNYPRYKGFRNDIVDYIKPVIKYKYEANVNPLLDKTLEKVHISFTTTDTNFLHSNVGLEDMKIYIDNMQVYGTGVNPDVAITAELSSANITDGSANGIKYTLTLSVLELNELLAGEIFERHSGVIKIEIAADQVADSSGNMNNFTTIIVDNDNGDDLANGVIVDFVNPIIYYHDKYVNWEDRYALVTVRATDRFFDTTTTLDPSDITLYELNDAGQYVQITSITQDDISIGKVANPYGYDFVIKLSNFEEEFKMKVVIAGGQIEDTSDNSNDLTEIIVSLDNKKPTWEYVSTDTSKFESEGTISFNVKGVDKFLDITNSGLDVADLIVLKDGEIFLDGTVAADATKITVNYEGANETEKSKSYSIEVKGLVDMGTYSLVFAKDTLIDEFSNKSAATTISFSNSVIASNTGNYTNVTYHVTPDQENVHSSYVHELMSVNTTGTNFENTTFRPTSLGELYNNGKNPLFSEPMYKPAVSGYTVTDIYAPMSFKGWAESDEQGNIIYYTSSDLTTVSTTKTSYMRIYGLYDDIPIPEDPNEELHLKAVWQDATVVFVSATDGDNSKDGGTPENAVKTLAKAYELIDTSASGTAENNIIIIMDEVEWNSNVTLTGNATITSLYAGVDYRAQGAELKVSSNMIIDGDITFDNIELYVSSTNNRLISNYSGDIIIGRGVSTPTDNYTFGAVIGGNYGTETSTAELGTHTIRVEAGKYNNIIAGSQLTTSTDDVKSVTHKLLIGNMRDAAVSRNDKLTITGYVAIGENEQTCYPSGATTANAAASKNYADVKLYSGTITSTDTAIYLRSINGKTDGTINFEMFGGKVTGNVYGGSRIASLYEGDIFNTMKFYGGEVTGNIFGQGLDDSFTGSTSITLQGIFKLTGTGTAGNVYGGSNVITDVQNSVGKGNSTITIDSSSVTVSGNIYGGSKAPDNSTSYVTGGTDITLKAGTVSGIYGSGYNCGNTAATNITINNGVVNANIFGGAYHNQARLSSAITVYAGTVRGNIYGGNDNLASQLEDDTLFQDVNITIGDSTTTEKPTVKGTIYGGGKYDKVDVTTIKLIENTDVISVFGGSDTNATTVTANIYLQGMTVNEIYGGGQLAGTVAISNIYLQSGTARDVYGGGSQAVVTESNILLEGTANVTSTIYGGSNTSGTVTTSNVTLKSGTVIDVFGGGDSAPVGTTNVLLDGITIDTIHGGSNNAGQVTTSNVTLNSGRVTNVFGGGFEIGATTANVTQSGADVTVTNIYGGNNSAGTESSVGGDTGTTNIKIENATVANVYGGNYLKGTTRYTNISIHGDSEITGKLYGGGYKSNIGKATESDDGEGNVTVTVTESGSTTINIAGGTINGDINGGSEQGVVYGSTNINIGKDRTDQVDSTLTAGDIEIKGTIYGAGDTENSDYEYTSVYGNTYIVLNNGTTSPITFGGSIFGAGKGSTYSTSGTNSDNSTVRLLDFGESTTNTHELISVERTGKLYIGNSFIEMTGRYDENNAYKQTSYTLNRITKGLTIYNTTLFTQRGFNMVNGFNSYVTADGTKATMENVNNRLYTLEGVNLIFASEEGDLSGRGTEDIWGNVNGMTFFGMYTKNSSGVKQYDESLFSVGTYVEAREKTSHNISVDGFYKDDGSGGYEVIGITDYGTYYDWIIGADVVNYNIQLFASTSGKGSVAELALNQNYMPEATYTLTDVSPSALVNADDVNVTLINSLTVPVISTNANNTFGLTMENSSSGWYSGGTANIYNNTFDGNKVFKSDSSATPGKLKFKIHNSLNVTETRDLGFVNLILTGKTKTAPDGSLGNTFIVVIAVNIQTIGEKQELQYTPTFKDRIETELKYTTDSRVDLSYILFKTMQDSPYATDGSGNITDYRVISSTIPFPAGTRITMTDYAQGDGLNKVYYYYQVPSNTAYDASVDLNGTTRYLYKLTNFTQMGSTDNTYVDSDSYYHSSDQYVLEKYDISIDFIDANVATNVSAEILAQAQETYIELRDSSGNVKIDNDEDNDGKPTIKYNLVTGKNAVLTETISNEGQSYSVVEEISIPITINASILEQTGVLDTKYHDKIAGIALQIVDEHGVGIASPELQNFKLTNAEDSTENYTAGEDGVIRVPVIDGLGSKSENYLLSIAQSNVPPGDYVVRVQLYTADDGKYFGLTPAVQKTFNVTFVSKLLGQVGVVADDASRIINKTTRLNFVEGSDATKAIDMNISIGNPTNTTNIRVELYKRNPTYTNLTDETTYTGTSYQLVDITQYIQGTWTKPEQNGLVSADGSKEYMVSPMKNYVEEVETETITFERALVEGISTGEYKLVFKAYNQNTLVQEVRKTFIVAP